MTRRVFTISAITCLVVTGAVLSICFAQSLVQSSKSGQNSNHAGGFDTGPGGLHSRAGGFYTKPTASKAVQERVDALMEQGTQMRKLAVSQMEAGDPKAAEQTIKQAIAFYEVYRPEFHYPLLNHATASRQILGDIYLREGQYQKALDTYGVVGQHTHGQGAVGASMNLNVALAYLRLGNYQMARRSYSDKAITQYSFSGQEVDPADLPGTDSPQALEASIQLARGIDSCFQEENGDAVADFAEAGKFIPDNPVLNYYWSDALLNLNRFSEAAPHAQIAAAHGHGQLAKAAHEKLESAHSGVYFLAKHPGYLTTHPQFAPKTR